MIWFVQKNTHLSSYFGEKKILSLNNYVYSLGWYSCKSTEARTGPTHVIEMLGVMLSPQKFHVTSAAFCCAQKLFQDLPKSPTADPVKVLFQILDDAWRRE